MENALTPQQVYDELWHRGSTALQRGQPQIDTFLTNRKSDLRRGYTLVFRPSAEIREAVGRFLLEAEQIAPEQHFYAPGELHTTVLSVIPGSVSWQQRLLELLRANRTTEFGEMRVAEVQLISGDWYASAESVEIVETYELK